MNENVNKLKNNSAPSAQNNCATERGEVRAWHDG